MNTRGYAAYQHSVTHTTQRKDDILMQLYDGAIRFVRLAQQAIAARQTAAKGEHISKVLAVLSELDCALDHDIGGEITANLSSLYHYMMERLSHANIHYDPTPLNEVEDLLCQLRQAFEAAIQEQTVTDAASAPAEPPLEVSPSPRSTGPPKGLNVAV